MLTKTLTFSEDEVFFLRELLQTAKNKLIKDAKDGQWHQVGITIDREVSQFEAMEARFASFDPPK